MNMNYTHFLKHVERGDIGERGIYRVAQNFCPLFNTKPLQ